MNASRRHILILLAAAVLTGAPRAGGQVAYVRKSTASESWAASVAAADKADVTLGPWRFLGPFDAAGGKGFETDYGPEKSADPAAVHKGKDGQPLRWRTDAKLVDGAVNDMTHLGANLCFYVARTIAATTAVDLPVLLGSDDTLTVWLNGRKLLSRKVNRACRLGDEQIVLKLAQGRNELLMKIVQGGGGAGFAFARAGDELAGVFQRRLIARIAEDFPLAQVRDLQVELEWQADGDRLAAHIAHREHFARLAGQVAHPEAMIIETDRDPADVVCRRTAALADRLKASRFAGELAALKARCETAPVADKAERRKLYTDLCRLRRRIAFSNPRLDFDSLLFIKRHRWPYGEGNGHHMCDQYFGFMATPGGGLFVLSDPFGPRAALRDVLDGVVCGSGRFEGKPLGGGAFLSPELSWDGRTVYFAWTEGEKTKYRWTERSCWHVFKVGADGSGLTQLTDGPTNDFDPCELPNGRVVFISERRGGYGRCHGRPVPVFTLHTMNPDGGDIVRISHHESNEWHPSVTHDGMIVYTRWDYVDRGFNQAHHPWLTTPDGRDARAITGNYPNRIGSRPWMEMDVRAVPGSRKLVATAAPHHGQAYGSLVLIDPAVPDDDAMAQVRRITPDANFPEAEGRPAFQARGDNALYATAWPLDETSFLCVWAPPEVALSDRDFNYGIYLVDAFGNRELIYRDPEISCLSPMPLAARPRPPVVPDAIRPEDRAAGADGTFAVMNVYDGRLPWPEGTKISALRIIQVLPKTTPPADNPRIGYGSQKSARKVLGTVPVEPDGSAHFECPSRVPVYFQALDERGLAVQSMRSDTYLQPGERLTCRGCHDRRYRPADGPPQAPAALRREPSKITPEAEGSNPFSYVRLVQPVLDKRCVGCHAKEDKAPDLSGARGRTWSRSYESLQKYAFYFNGAAETTSRTVPGQFGARASKLLKMLDAGHHDAGSPERDSPRSGVPLKLSAAELRRITLWLDCNSDFYGAYEKTDEQFAGKIVQPSLE